MDHRNYVVRQTPGDWIVELDGVEIGRSADRGDAIATATSAARETAARDFVMCRVSLATDRGCFPLTAFGSRLEQQQKMMKRMTRQWVDAA
jgi:hypothetical protein